MTDTGMYRVTNETPAHLRDWQLPPGWTWGAEGVLDLAMIEGLIGRK